MDAQVKVQALYAFPTREEERAEKKEIESHGRFFRIRTLWRRQHHRQELYRAAVKMVEQLQQTEKTDVFLDLLREKRRGEVPCLLHPVTMARNQFFPGEENEVADRALVRNRINAEDVEQALSLSGVVVGSRVQRSQFWDFVEMILRGHTPTDLLVQHDCEQQFALQRSLLEAWECKWGRSLVDYAQGPNTEESDRELGVIYNGHAQGVECYSSLGRDNIRRYAALYWKAGHSQNSWCTVLVRKGYKSAYLGFPREGEPDEQPRVGTRPLQDWLDYGADSIAEFPYPVKRRPGSRYSNKLPGGPLNVGEAPATGDEFVEHQLFGLAQGVFRKWPPSQKPLLLLIEERLCNRRQRRYDEKCFHNPNAGPFVPQVEQVEQDLLGRVFTEGSPVRREIFWVYMCALALGMKEFCRAGMLRHEYSPSKTHSYTVIKVASQLIAEGANPFHKSKLIAYGRGGLSPALAPDDPLVLVQPRQYAELRMLAGYGMVDFEI